ncbi:MAG: type II toxin-antitoxin system RelE/ParE family toxin [Desulfovibrio sp.]|jgi:hypothetical protein|nr:type II toxin-antitoxin system RelE/ParE family toxin [Desulfovibrio sp.]
MKWTVDYLNEAVRQEVWALPNDMRAGIVRNAEMIEAVGLERVGMPYVRHVRGKLWEIHATGRDGIAEASMLPCQNAVSLFSGHL